jgi:hypothetical protein
MGKLTPEELHQVKVNNGLRAKAMGNLRSGIPPKNASHPLTLKQIAFARKVARTLKPTESAMAVYKSSTRDAARKTAKRNMKNPKILEILGNYVTDEDISRTLKDQLAALKVSYTPEGRMEDPDNMARLKAVDIALKVKGAYPQDALKLGGGQGNTFNFIISKAEKRLIPEEDIVEADVQGAEHGR